jgi:hypothetical protein
MEPLYDIDINAKRVESPKCPSEDACKIVNSFLEDNPTEAEYGTRMLIIQQRIIDNDFIIEELKVKLNNRIEEKWKLQELLFNNCNES